ncbi:hypothetical protein OTU49_007105, partial [Cherax quadricarinatus]
IKHHRHLHHSVHTCSYDLQNTPAVPLSTHSCDSQHTPIVPLSTCSCELQHTPTAPLFTCSCDLKHTPTVPLSTAPVIYNIHQLYHSVYTKEKKYPNSMNLH